MNKQQQQNAMLKLATVRLAINHVLRSRAMQKKAEGDNNKGTSGDMKRWVNPNFDSEGRSLNPPREVDSNMFPKAHIVPNYPGTDIPRVNTVWHNNTVPKVKPEYEYILRLGDTIGTGFSTGIDTENKYNLNTQDYGRGYAYGLAEEASKGRLTPEQLQAGQNILTDLYNGNNPRIKATVDGKTKEPYPNSVSVVGTPVYPLEGVEYSDRPTKQGIKDMAQRYLTSPGVESKPYWHTPLGVWNWLPWAPTGIDLKYE